MKITWLTDIHLNFLAIEKREKLYNEIIEEKPNSILISGDIAEADSISDILIEIENNVKLPVYFVMGNHDYYGSTVASVKTKIHELTNTHNNLCWIAEENYKTLTPNTLLVGVDGWADGRYGDYDHSSIVLNDSLMITELFQAKCLGKTELLQAMQVLADKDALCMQEQLNNAVQQTPKQIIVLTHVPPFAEACVYQNQQTNCDFLPFFSSKATGDILLAVAKKYPEIHFIVLCGHTHEATSYQALSNLVVKVGGAKYGKPKVVETITL